MTRRGALEACRQKNHSWSSTSAKKVVVVGQGYVGLPVALRAVEVGYNVVGLDIDEQRVQTLASSQSFLAEVSSKDVAKAIATGRYLPSRDDKHCGEFDFAIIAVPTPLLGKEPDVSYIVDAAKRLAPYISNGACVILESTSFPGTTEEVLVPELEQGSGLVAGQDFFVGFSPERIDPGNPTWHFSNTPKLVAGINQESLTRVRDFYSELVATVVTVNSCSEAELAKLLENTFRHVNVAMVNELLIYARSLGIDPWAAIEAASTKPFGFMKFTPGPGVGGHCLPVDPSYLSWHIRQRLGADFRFVDVANEVNDGMPLYVADRVMSALREFSRGMEPWSVLVLGVAYKPNTGDVRESPAVQVLEELMRRGVRVVASDPHVSGMLEGDVSVEMVQATAEAAGSADCVLILTPHDAFDLPALVRGAKLVFDTRHCVEGSNVIYL